MQSQADPQLSRRERQILDILYQNGQATAAEIQERMADPPSYSAVRALLRVLEEKGHVHHEQQGQKYVYSPAREPEKARESALRHVLRTFFGGSAAQAVAALLDMSAGEMPQDDLDRLSSLIHKAKEEGR